MKLLPQQGFSTLVHRGVSNSSVGPNSFVSALTPLQLSQLNLTVSRNATHDLRREKSHGGWSSTPSRKTVYSNCHTRTHADELPVSQHGFMVDVEATRTTLLQLEDTNGNGHITADDVGPKVCNPKCCFHAKFIRTDIIAEDCLGYCAFQRVPEIDRSGNLPAGKFASIAHCCT